MWKGIIYKEWLKVRWFYLIYAVIGTLGIAYIFLKVQHDISFGSHKSFWYFNLFQGGQYFGLVKFVPLAGALMISMAQFFPETICKRIKLTFHLPINENRVLLMMWTFGTLCLVSVYLIQMLLFIGLSFVYLPTDIILPALSSITPWFLAGFASYNLMALIVLEPVWKYRVFYSISSALFVSYFLQSALTQAFSPINWIIIVLTVLSSFSLLFSGYRFRKGEM